jgi:hypothetical protein
LLLGSGDRRATDKAAYFKSIGYEPHPGQWPFHTSTARYKVLVAGTKFGKSLCGARDAEHKLLTPNKHGWIVAPTYDLGEKEFQYIFDSLVVRQQLTTNWHYNVRAGRMDIKLPWGSWVKVKSAEKPKTLLAEELDFVLIAEAAKLKREVWERFLRGRLLVRHGEAIFPTTPSGRNFIEELFLRGQSVHHPSWESWQFPTSMNPYIDPEEIAEAQATLTDEYFAEQYLAQFVALTGRVYKDFDRMKHVVDPFPIPTDWRRIRGVDFGYHNPFVCLWGAISPDDELYIYDEHYQSGWLIAQHAKAILARGGQYEATIADHEAQERAELDASGVPTVPANKKDKRLNIQLVAQRFKSDRLFFFRTCEHSISEHERLHYPERREEQAAKEEPQKVDDHTCDTTQYMVAYLDGAPEGPMIITAEDLGLVEPVAIGSDYGSEEI